MVWLINQEWDFAYQIRGDEEADLESCSRWIPSDNPNAIYRKSWWGDKSVMIQAYDNSTYSGIVCDFDARGNVTLEYARVLWHEAIHAYLRKLHRVSVDEIRYIKLIPKGYAGWRLLPEDDREDNKNNRWDGWCANDRET